MRKLSYIWLLTTLYMSAAPIELGIIDVEASVETEVFTDLPGEVLKSADLATALLEQSPSVSMVRRSGIANDIIIRGQKKDNISVTVDGAKIQGACPNRMDPPISHILTNHIDYIVLNEGPFDVEEFGALSATVKVHTKKPTKAFSGELSAKVGAFDYQKGAFSVSSGGERVRFLLSGSREKGGQYKDGAGHTFAQQQDSYIQSHPGTEGTGYVAQSRTRDAFEKKTLMAKMFWDITDAQAVTFGYTANRSNDILYPNTAMDALYDDSDIYTLGYTVKHLGRYAKKLTVDMYQSTVDHPMASTFRKAAKSKGVIKHQLQTKIQGMKVKNEFDSANHTFILGLDYSKRYWDGGFYKDDVRLPESKYHSIWDAQTRNMAFFVKDTIAMRKWEFNLGLRGDNTLVTTGRKAIKDNHYDGVSGNVLATYTLDTQHQYFAGVGISSRVPDGKELYFHKPGKAMHPQQEIGTADLSKVMNRELDVGVTLQYDDIHLKAKAFYSDFKDYIVYNALSKRFENVDATLWGVSLSGSYMATESLYFEYGLAYQRGKKKKPLKGQVGKNVAEITPVKLNISMQYAYDEHLAFKATVISAGKWKAFDFENGEQALAAYTVCHLKVTKLWGKHFEIAVGVDNVFDTNYALSNTYKDLTLVAGAGEDEVMLLNEPGRYVYTNIKYIF